MGGCSASPETLDNAYGIGRLIAENGARIDDALRHAGLLN